MDNRKAVPSSAEFGQLIATIAKMGLTSQIARTILGNGPAGRTRQEIVDILRSWLKNR